MSAQQIGSVWIMGVGLLILAGSFGVTHVAARTHGVLALVGSPLLRWMTRLLGALVFTLGLVTYCR